MNSDYERNLDLNKLTPRSELIRLYEKHGISDHGRAFIEHLRTSPPSKAVGRKKSNMSVRFQSKKMGGSIHCASRTVEYLFALYFELMKIFLEFWDQPPLIKLSYRSKNGKRVGVMHTPDFFVIAEDFVGFIECKDDSSLEKLREQFPERYITDEAGQWICPPGIEAAAKYGVGYRVAHPRLISSQLYRNVQFLYDYLAPIPSNDIEDAIEKVADVVRREKIIRLDALIEEIGDCDSIYWAIAHRRIHFNYLTDLLVRPEGCHIYASEIYSDAISIFNESYKPITSSSVTVRAGETYLWDGIPWEILNCGINQFTLRRDNNEIITLTEPEVSRLVRDGSFQTTSFASKDYDPIRAKLIRASPTDLSTANERYETLFTPNCDSTVSDRTVRHWKQLARQSQISEGSDFIGLLPRVAQRGNRDCKINADQDSVLNYGIETFYLVKSAPTVIEAYRKYTDHCEKNTVDAVSYTTFRIRINKINEKNRKEPREGKKSAYQVGPTSLVSETSIPTHGDRPFEIAHVDHTPLEIILSSAITGEPLGTPWLTMLIDAFTKCILAFYLTFEKPSYRSVMCVIRECVRRHGRLPRCIAVDGGKEFHSIYFQTLGARYAFDILERPPGEPRFGAPVERAFGTTHSEFVHTLAGNSKNYHLGRSLSATHDPKNLAIWTPDQFSATLTQWMFEVYPTQRRFGTMETPNDRLERASKITGSRSHTFIKYDSNFILHTLPFVDGETRKLKGACIRFNHLDYKSSDQLYFQDSGTLVPVRYDPYDAIHIYVYADGSWRQFFCTDALLREYSERGIQLIHQEVMARGLRTGREYYKRTEAMINFSESIRNKEKVLIDHKLEIKKQQINQSTEIQIAPTEDQTLLSMPIYSFEDC